MALSVTHSTVAVTPDDGTSEVGSDEWNAAHTVSGTLDIASGGTGTVTGARTRLTANTNFYVRSDGSDSNTGLANTSGGAWLTIQKAATYICSQLDFGGYTCTLNVGAGTFDGANFVGGPPSGSTNVGGGYLDIVLGGVGVTFIRPNSTNFHTALYFRGIIASGLRISGGVEFLPSGGAFGTYLRLTDLALGVGVSANMKAQGDVKDIFIQAGNVGYAEIIGTHTIAGPLLDFLYCFTHYHCYIAGTLVLQNTPAFAEAFVLSNDAAEIAIAYNTITGTATGKRFWLQSGSSLLSTYSVNGGSLTDLPGNVAGTAEDGCKYNGGFLNSRHVGVTYAQRPTAPSVLGQMCCFTDSTVNTWGATIAGGGSNKVLGWYNGTNWTVVGI